MRSNDIKKEEKVSLFFRMDLVEKVSFIIYVFPISSDFSLLIIKY